MKIISSLDNVFSKVVYFMECIASLVSDMLIHYGKRLDNLNNQLLVTLCVSS